MTIPSKQIKISELSFLTSEKFCTKVEENRTGYSNYFEVIVDLMEELQLEPQIIKGLLNTQIKEKMEVELVELNILKKTKYECLFT